MDHLSFVFSLLLIVSVTTTTFGSAINANKPNGEELEERGPDMSWYPEMAPSRKELEELRSGPDLGLYPETAPNRKEREALLKRLNKLNPGVKKEAEAKLHGQKDLEDQDREKSKRKVDAGALTPGKDLTPDLLKEDDADTAHELVIGIENNSGYAWNSPTVFYFTGEAGSKGLTDPLNNGKASLYHVQRKKSEPLLGVSGLLAYHIPSINSTLAVMFNFPAFFSQYLSFWNVMLFPGKKEADCKKFALEVIFFPKKAGVLRGGKLSKSSRLRFDGIMTVDSVEGALAIVVDRVKQK